MIRAAVLLIAHGTAETLEQIPDFLLKIRRGRPPSDELVAETRRRYGLIGGSPLLRITQAQAAALEKELAMPVAVAMRLWDPTVAEVLPPLVARGIERVCVLPMAPFSVDLYYRAAVAAARDVQVELINAGAWGTDPALLDAHAHAIQAAGPADAIVVTAHSLPLAALRRGDRYAIEVEDCVEGVRARLGREVVLAYQSQNDETEWLGPDLRTILRSVSERGAKRVVLEPLGFLADHVETLYDLDVEAQGWAKEWGIELVRVPALNTAPGLIRAMASVARRALGA